MASKKKTKRKHSDDFKAELVARALRAQESGDETVKKIAEEKGIGSAMLYGWIKKAKRATTAEKKKARPPRASKSREKATELRSTNINSLARELAHAMDHVDHLKRRMRKLLGPS